MEEIEKSFNANTIHLEDYFNGEYSIKCKKGLWAVFAPTKEIAEREARHYFIQYYGDGEYSV